MLLQSSLSTLCLAKTHPALYSRASLAIPTPSQYVRASLARLGSGPVTSPWIYHQFVNLLLDTVPCWLRVCLCCLL